MLERCGKSCIFERSSYLLYSLPGTYHCQARSANSNRAPQIFGRAANRADRRYMYDGRELPDGASAKLSRDEATICYPPDVAAQVHRI